MVEKTHRTALRAGLETGLQFVVAVAVVGGWNWATWGVEAESPATPVFLAIWGFVQVASLTCLIAWMFLNGLDARRQMKSALRNSSALGRVTDDPRAPRGNPRPILTAVFLAMMPAPWGFIVVPDFIALASGPDPLRTLVAATCVAVGIGGYACAVVVGVRRELKERRIRTTGVAA